MPDTVVHIGENSPEQVAYRLMIDVFTSEKKGVSTVDRETILNTYSQCLVAVRDPYLRRNKVERD